MRYFKRFGAAAIVVAGARSRDEREPADPPQPIAFPAAASGALVRSATSPEARQSGPPSFGRHNGPCCELVCWSGPLTADVPEARARESGVQCSNRQCCTWFCY